MKKTNEIKDTFSKSLRSCLNNYYGKVPSASVFARDFNLRAYGTTPITQESARRWIRGVSLPEEGRVRVLIDWLGLDYNEILRISSQLLPTSPNNGSIKKDTPTPQYGQHFNQGVAHFQTNGTANHYSNGHTHNHVITDQINSISSENNEILNLMSLLDSNKRRIVAEIIRAIQTQ